MKNVIVTNKSISIMTILLVLTLALSLSAQIRNIPTLVDTGQTDQVDTAHNPHDFTDKYYAINGIAAENIISRRTGNDFLSVISYTSNPNQSPVRVLATIPAYGENGEILFFSPLGELADTGFINDPTGWEAMNTANNHPIYVFPKGNAEVFAFNEMRQAPIITMPQTFKFAPTENVLGLRVIIVVNYTAKVRSGEDQQVLDYMYKKNGVSLDKTPLIKSMEDIQMLEKYGFVELSRRRLYREDASTYDFGSYTISPIISNPTKGVIAPDAFLMNVNFDGVSLADEVMFYNNFNCLKRRGDWCYE